jgi:LPS-assembly protein
MNLGRGIKGAGLVLRPVLAAGLLILGVGAAWADDEGGLLPAGFFDRLPHIADHQASITADNLTYNADAHQVTADGHVELGFNGFTIIGDHLVFDRQTHEAHFAGHVIIHAPEGTIYNATDLQLTDEMQRTLMQELTITTVEGALVTSSSGEFQSGVQTVLNDGTYAPCGQCVDSKGRKIGWQVRAARMIYHSKSQTITLEQPTLYLLGIPVAWLPWLSLPDPTKRTSGFRAPSVDYSGAFGARLNTPYFMAVGNDTDLIFTPSFMSRQGVLLTAEWDQRFVNGAFKVKTSGIYQLDPSAYATEQIGAQTWRGAFQTTGEFVPFDEWNVGWSYTAFTDPDYLIDYHEREDKDLVNEVYATHLSRDEFINFRLQQFNLLGDVTNGDQNKQARALPNASYHNVIRLAGDNGEIDVNASLLGVQRGTDANLQNVGPVPVPYRFGYEENKAHAMLEAGWQKQYIAGGFAITPYAGIRADAAYYDGLSPLKPGQIDLFNATPIAAVDIRFPLIGRDGTATHIIEPITQLVYRASDVTDVGITNDNAQNFVFEDTNLFSYNRFSGTDRQETGLRANIGAHYQLNFAGGQWLDLLGGQSFQLAGANAFAAADPTQATTAEGLSSSASYVVLGATGSLIPNMTFGGKLQVDPATPRITRAGLGSTYSVNNYDFAADYLYIAANSERGVTKDQHEVSGSVGVPFQDYWKVSTRGAWDIASNTWLAAGVGVHYDDGYLYYGADLNATGPTNTDANDLSFTATFRIKGPKGQNF